MHRQQGLGMAADLPREYWHGRENPTTCDQFESGAVCQLQVFGDRAVSGVLEFRRRADQAALQQEVNARLQVREVGNGYEQLPVTREHAVQFLERFRLFLERQVLEHVEAERAIEAAVRVGKRRERSRADSLGRVVLIEAFDRKPRGELVDEHALTATGVEDACAGGQAARASAAPPRASRCKSDSSPRRDPATDDSRRAPRTRRREPPGGCRS